MNTNKVVVNLIKNCVFGSDDWIAVGYKIAKLDAETAGCIFWHNYSKQDSNYNKKECDKYWEIFVENINFGVKPKEESIFIESNLSEPDNLPEGW